MEKDATEEDTTEEYVVDEGAMDQDATEEDVLLQSQRSHSGNFNVQNSSSEFDGQGKCFCRLFCSQIKEANCPKLSNLTITICL